MSNEIANFRTEDRLSRKLPNRIFKHVPGEFADEFNRRPFAISHNLGNHPLFELPRLIELAKSLWALGGSKVLFQEGNASFNDRWDAMRQKKALSFIKGISDIQRSSSWVLLKSVQEDKEYLECIDVCVTELSEITGVDLKKEISWIDGYVFIASPGAVTPHHIDHESNFLLQVHGEKNINVCTPSDRSVLFEEEIENYYVGDLSAAGFKSVSQQKAHVFPMVPGSGVHIPSKGPHWVRNDEQYSVSFSINFCMRETDRSARIYQCNHYLRRLDFKPTPPGRSVVKDWLKIMALGRLGTGRIANKNELLRRNVNRLERASRIIERVFRRPTNTYPVKTSENGSGTKSNELG